ncbi:VOC family protein [Fusibacter sp. 3D3]|uniref:VOC family protein n=1 Tax=Fusibacter sp. 3D3 TaxID=1048380 RepID=UPI0008529DF0|nr:VOC family protein [Fusibacter sp. 3D3]GAU79287.1 methylmalonyl-CoA epimerase [Fusibacter sp. 3D3]
MQIDHIGIACADAAQFLELYCTLMNGNIGQKTKYEEMGLDSTFINFNDTKIELLEPFETNSVISKFLDQRGNGLHHISFKVENIEAFYDRINKTGHEFLHEIRTIHEINKVKKYTFLSLRVSNNIMIEVFEEIIKNEGNAYEKL